MACYLDAFPLQVIRLLDFNCLISRLLTQLRHLLFFALSLRFKIAIHFRCRVKLYILNFSFTTFLRQSPNVIHKLIFFNLLLTRYYLKYYKCQSFFQHLQQPALYRLEKI